MDGCISISRKIYRVEMVDGIRYACVSKDVEFLKKAENKLLTLITDPIGLYLYLKRSIELGKL